MKILLVILGLLFVFMIFMAADFRLDGFSKIPWDSRPKPELFLDQMNCQQYNVFVYDTYTRHNKNIPADIRAHKTMLCGE